MEHVHHTHCHHDHDHGHTHHGHHHHHHHEGNRKGLLSALIISALIVGFEIWGGLKSHSISLLSDSVHMFTDVLALAVSLVANVLSKKQNHNKNELSRSERYATMFNGLMLILCPIWIVWEAIDRFVHPPEVMGGLMMLIAVFGLLANLLSAWIMVKTADVKDNLNIRGAYLHVLTDAWGSAGVIITALLITWFGWRWADPLISIIMSIFIAKGGIGIFMELNRQKKKKH